MPDPSLTQLAAFLGAFGITAATLAQIFIKVWRPDAGNPESSGRRENKADVLAEATMRLTAEVDSLRRDVESLKDMQLKLIDLTVKGLSKI